MDKELDATGLRCPLPVLKARKVIKNMEAGQTLQVRATDPGSPQDMQAFCDSGGHTLHRSVQEDSVFIFEIEKGSD